MKIETQKEKLMRVLGITEEEALEIIECDKRIDKGEKLFELPEELAGGAKKARQAPRKQNSTPTKREKKVDLDKSMLIEIIKGNLEFHDCEILDVINDEREFTFNYSGKKYKIVLSCPRS